MLIKNRIFYDAPENGGSGGVQVSEVSATPESVETTPLDQGEVGATPEGTPEVTETTEVNTEEETGEEGNTEEEGFDPEKVEFDDGTKAYEFLKDDGIDAKDPEYKSIIEKINGMGVTDPEIVAKFVREYKREKELTVEKPLTQKETMAKLNKELTPELKRNYSKISNVLKKAFEGDEELQGTYESVMSSAYGIKLVNAIMKASNGGIDPNPTPASVPKASGGVSMNEAITKFDKLSAESRSKNGNLTMDEKNRIVSEISSSMNPSDVKKFKERYL